MSKAGYIYNAGMAFREAAKEHAGRTALQLLDGEKLSYAQLDALSNQVAQFFLAQGLRPKDVVAIFNVKLPMAYAAMLACLKLGVTYTNLDPSSPPQRLAKMFDVCRPRLIFADTASAANASVRALQCPVINYEDQGFQKTLTAVAADFPAINATITGQYPAYIMFTSGSTGFPKGAVMTQANLLNFIRWGQSTFAITPQERLTNLNPMHFDNSVFDFYAALFNGASLVPVPEALLKNPRQLLDALNPMGCTMWFSVPSLIVYVLKMRALKKTDLPALKTISFGGEGFPKAQLRTLYDLVGDRVSLVNVYGPTECTCICSSYVVTKEDLVSDDLLPLGPVAPNFDQFILDEQGKVITDGSVGELCLGGPNVGLGYYRLPEKTAEQFIQDPRHQHYRDIYYKTGDLVRYDAAKDILYFCGRKDNQVKRMGYRIELEEIEFAIGALSYVNENGVVFIRKGADIGRIVAYVSATVPDELKLVEDLRRQLPPYMIPDRVVFMDMLPKNPNGKIDRRAIKAMEEKA